MHAGRIGRTWTRMCLITAIGLAFMVTIAIASVLAEDARAGGKEQELHQSWICSSGIRVFDDGYMSWDAIAVFTGSALTFVTVLFAAMQIRNANKLESRQIYQTLELASAQLFRFEAENEKLVELLWDDNTTALDDLSPGRKYALKEYVCQMLNLFEMAVRLRKQKILEPEVFGSWVVWMWELSDSRRFRHLWIKEDLAFNYVGDLRQLMHYGVKLEDKSHQDRRKKFFKGAAKQFDDDSILKFLDKPQDVQPMAGREP